MPDLPIVDGHLDLAENVTLFGYDLTVSVSRSAAQTRKPHVAAGDGLAARSSSVAESPSSVRPSPPGFWPRTSWA